MRLATIVRVVLVAALVAACGPMAPAGPGPLASIPPDGNVHVTNGTTLDVSIFVNGLSIGTVRAGDEITIESGRLPTLPWTVEARSPSGRLILPWNVEVGQIQEALDGTGASGATATLTCGVFTMRIGTV
ncbi:MAG TPA: hypothetical protein VK194_02380, partial [Candidatus Deferrimicrobium sp.]|nr:hypothetical protein [Candidatus Deferrimicrobium sp.]